MSNGIDLDHLLAQLIKRTAQLLQNSQAELRQITWQDGEANTDSGFSQLARSKFRQAFTELSSQYPGTQLVHLAKPDIIAILSDLQTKIQKNQRRGLRPCDCCSEFN